MCEFLKPTILLIGLDRLYSNSTKEHLLTEPFNFINALELQLSDQLKYDVIAVLIIGIPDDVNIIYELPNLRVISCMSSGTDYLDMQKLYSKNVTIRNCSDETADSTSEVALLLILNLSRRIPKAIQALHNSSLFHNRFNEYFGSNINKKVLGIIGFGKIGQALAHKASVGLGMKIVYHQRNKKSNSLFQYHETLNEMLPKVDFLVISCPLTNQTKHFINLDRLKLMKPTAYLINVARGGIVKTNDLLEAVRCGIIAGAGLDVTDPEPLPSSHPLLHMNNVIVLPHIGTFTVEAQELMLNRSLKNLKESLYTI